MAVVNNAAMKAEVHASFQIMVFLQLYARSGTAGLYGRSSLKGASILFSIVVVTPTV